MSHAAAVDPAPRRAIVDCFTFYNELDMLEYRLKVLAPHVDWFVLVESHRTFVGRPKELFYENNKARYAAFHDKIIHVVVDIKDEDLPPLAKDIAWRREFSQRNSIMRGLERLTADGRLCDRDIVLIADLDEIHGPRRLQELPAAFDAPGATAFSLQQDMYIYNYESHVAGKWTLPRACTYGHLRGTEPQALRNSRRHPILPRSGWHLSYFGSVEFIVNKVSNFAHQEASIQRHNDAAKVAARLRARKDLFLRENTKITHRPLHTNPYPPPEPELLEALFGGLCHPKE